MTRYNVSLFALATYFTLFQGFSLLVLGMPLGECQSHNGFRKALVENRVLVFIPGIRPKACCRAGPQFLNILANEHYTRLSVKVVSPSNVMFVLLGLPISAASYGLSGNGTTWCHHCEHCCSQQPHTDVPFWRIK